MLHLKSRTWRPVFLNSLGAFVPEMWALESLMVLYATTSMLPLVHRDFSNEIKSQGDIVNTRRPGKFNAKRKVDGDTLIKQNATATNVPVALDQHIYTSFIIYDGEESKGFSVLRDEYLVPALESIAQQIDLVLYSQIYQFLGNVVGKLGTTPTNTTVIAARTKLNTNKCPSAGRNLVITSNTEGALLGIDNYITADKVGDEGSALREGSLGRKHGFQIFHSQNAASIAVTDLDAGTVNNGSGYPAGTTTMTTANLSGDWDDGQWFTVAGDMIPHQVTTNTAGTSVTFVPALVTDVVDTAVITRYMPGQVDETNNYALGYNKELVIDEFTIAPQVGQMVTIGVGASIAEGHYGALATPTTTALLLSHSLKDALAVDDAEIMLGPAGDYNFAFHRNAIGFISRPLAQPEAGTGVKSFVANYKDLALRVSIWYDGNVQGHLVTVDILAGVKVFDTNLGCVMLA